MCASVCVKGLGGGGGNCESLCCVYTQFDFYWDIAGAFGD